ncbi:hypothetical protein [Thiorhodococcus drewsii]|uniref:hypothetical protein n=1 Tax=Thiorhodococcus drewsii TaxID=210408 RepID=UPI001112B3B2|nr:hypothetical protein [Thiorhodococcus drewsii]
MNAGRRGGVSLARLSSRLSMRIKARLILIGLLRWGMMVAERRRLFSAASALDWRFPLLFPFSDALP